VSTAFKCDGPCGFYFDGEAKSGQVIELGNDLISVVITANVKGGQRVDFCEKCFPVEDVLRILRDYVFVKGTGGVEVEWIEPWEAADILGVTTGPLRVYASRGDILCKKGSGPIRPKRRYSKASVLEYAQKRRER